MKEYLLPLVMLGIGLGAGSKWIAQPRELSARWRSGYEMGKEVGAAEERMRWQGRGTEVPLVVDEPKGLTDRDRQQRWSETFENESAVRNARGEEERAAAIRRAQENAEHWRLLEAAKNR